MLRKIISWIPNAITCCNLLAGCVAVAMSFHLGDDILGLTGQQWLYICIAAAAVFDFCDGLAARLLKAYSAIGKELDSLSDLVSFGVAPGMLMLNYMMAQGTSPWLAAVALIIPVFGALRLAKFNVDDSQASTFKGLPIPANALFWIGFSAWMLEYGYPGWIITDIIIVMIASCMVMNFSMFSLKFKSLDFRENVKRYAIVLAAIAFVVLYGVSGLAWTILLYLLMSLFSKHN